MTVDRIYEQLNEHLQSNDMILLDGWWVGNMVVSRLVLDKRKKKQISNNQNNEIMNTDVNLGGLGYKSREMTFVNNLGIVNINVDINCLAYAVLLSMSIIEKGNLYRAFMAGFDRYLKSILREDLFEIENLCFVKEQHIPMYNMNLLYKNYLKKKNYHLCVYTENDKMNDEVLLYDSYRKVGEIAELSDRKLILLHKNNHFDIIQNLGLFLY